MSAGQWMEALTSSEGSNNSRASHRCRYPTSRQLAVAQQAALDAVLPAGHKKAPKIYAIACHPLQPHIVAVGTNAGARYSPASAARSAGARSCLSAVPCIQFTCAPGRRQFNVLHGLQAWACCPLTAGPGSRWPRCRWRPRPRQTWTARARARALRPRASAAASTCWRPSRSSGTWLTGAAGAQTAKLAPAPRLHPPTMWRPARPGWSEGSSGRQLTADLSFKRSVAALDSGLGEPASHAQQCRRGPRCEPY